MRVTVERRPEVVMNEKYQERMLHKTSRALFDHGVNCDLDVRGAC